MKTWAEVREARIRQLGERCEICGRTFDLLGHHIIPRSVQKPLIEALKEIYPENWEELYSTFFLHTFLCRIRCADCEHEMHRLYKWGNSTQDQSEAYGYFKAAVSILLKKNG